MNRMDSPAVSMFLAIGKHPDISRQPIGTRTQKISHRYSSPTGTQGKPMGTRKREIFHGTLQPIDTLLRHIPQELITHSYS